MTKQCNCYACGSIATSSIDRENDRVLHEFFHDLFSFVVDEHRNRILIAWQGFDVAKVATHNVGARTNAGNRILHGLDLFVDLIDHLGELLKFALDLP